ncbi:BIRC2 family protein [Megaselia abdita]
MATQNSFNLLNYEENRLRTFISWPPNSPVDPERLARAGFYYSGNGLETTCFACDMKISNWEFGDQAMDRHARMNVVCPFIRSPSECRNVPIIREEVMHELTSSNRGKVVQQQQNFKTLKVRLGSFKNWPNTNISPGELAKAGFYYFNVQDQVKCAWCSGIIAKWEKDDNAFDEHNRFFPNCPRVQLGPLIDIASDGIQNLGIQQIQEPVKPKYSTLDARVRTFDEWPIPQIQKPEVLAEAGFYFTRPDDQVRCFHCNGGLRSWQKEDDPWFEHAKWFPQCNFVRLVKGVTYVQQVEESGGRERAATTSVPQRPSMTVDEAMMTDQVKQVLDMGLNAGRIRRAVINQLQNSGDCFQSIEELVEAVLEEQVEEEGEEEERAVFTNRVPERLTTRDDSSTSNDNIHKVANSDSGSVDETQMEQSNGETKMKESSSLTLEEENRILKDARLCKVCMDEEVGVVFLPCGHLVTCVQCAPGVKQCPLCRSDIKGYVRTFLS